MSARCKRKISDATLRRVAALHLDDGLGYVELKERFGLARATIHKAIEQLREARRKASA